MIISKHLKLWENAERFCRVAVIALWSDDEASHAFYLSELGIVTFYNGEIIISVFIAAECFCLCLWVIELFSCVLKLDFFLKICRRY